MLQRARWLVHLPLGLALVAGCGDGIGRPIERAVSQAGGAPGTGGVGNGAGGFALQGGSAGLASMGGGGGREIPDTALCASVRDWPSDFALLEDQAFASVNAARAFGLACGSTSRVMVGELELSPELRCAARLHARDMADRTYVSHVNPEGQGPSQRIALTGRTFGAAGETIIQNTSGAGANSFAAVAAFFTSDDPECQNLVDARFDALGVGYFGGRWVLDLTGP